MLVHDSKRHAVQDRANVESNGCAACRSCLWYLSILSL